ncbi:DUF4389 domain-containing protein [Jidongwangia harbinensis]|uniref:DUF4389 domain-containing protein n=1 Tax=Jidongwangia harbinensis TaxID=2878561 RepID=UPI001CDA06B9|nr:DUF4389 domain-containing protein [Jidongwangia harbinensis]MCA2218989.1 DUF4389 domain-containing protein [Jidongwangia harbinensis]
MNRYPLRVEAHRDESLSRWLWLVKWLLLIPHVIVLIVLWTGLVVLTLVAYLAVLFTGRYPAAIAAYHTGVLRWTWRVSYYGYQVLGTDRYPPFTLADVPDYPARLSVTGHPRPPRWLPLVAWLFAVPHVLLLGALTGAITWEFDIGDGTTRSAPISVVAAGVLIAAAALLFTGRYPRGLYDLLVGVARWNLRLIAYLLLLTPRYPPFRLDQGDREPDDDPAGAAAAAPVAPRTASHGVAGPVTALIAGVLLLAPGAGLAVAGGALLALDRARDDQGFVSAPVMSMRSTTAAVTAEGITLSAGDVLTRGFTDIGEVRITVTGTAGQYLFVGIAPESAVDAWLAGTAHDELESVSSGMGDYVRSGGAVRAVSAPVTQDFWLATGTGAGTATVSWRATDGNFAVVLANGDGSTGIVGDVEAATNLPDLTGLGGGLLGAGIALTLLAVALIILGGTGLGRRHGSGPRDRGLPPAPPVTGPPPAYVTTSS